MPRPKKQPVADVKPAKDRWAEFPAQTPTHGDLTPAFVRYFFENDEAGAREYYASRMNAVEVREAMEALELQ